MFQIKRVAFKLAANVQVLLILVVTLFVTTIVLELLGHEAITRVGCLYVAIAILVAFGKYELQYWIVVYEKVSQNKFSLDHAKATLAYGKKTNWEQEYERNGMKGYSLITSPERKQAQSQLSPIMKMLIAIFPDSTKLSM